MRSQSLAAVLGLSLGLSAMMPMAAIAEALTVMRGTANAPLAVPMNRAVVVESDTPFAELSVANPGIADISTLSDKTIHVLGKTPGRTTLTLLSQDGRLISNVEVHVTSDIEEFKERLMQILPGERIEVRTANDGIVLSGTVSSTAKLDRALDLANRYAPDKVSNLLMVAGTQQVMLKVRFAEMQRSVSKSLSSSIGLRGGAMPGCSARPAPWPSKPPAASEAASSTCATARKARSNSASSSKRWNPRASCAPWPSPTSPRCPAKRRNSSQAGNIRSRSVRISTPSPSNTSPSASNWASSPSWSMSINLQITAAVSSIDTTTSVTANGLSINAFKRRDGESFAIAGLLQDDFSDLNNQVPWLGDVPILGALFRSATYQRKQSELVIIATPHLVSPVRGEALALPTDRLRLPSETELFLFGKTAGQQKGAAGEVARQDFSGSYGYSME